MNEVMDLTIDRMWLLSTLRPTVLKWMHNRSIKEDYEEVRKMYLSPLLFTLVVYHSKIQMSNPTESKVMLPSSIDTVCLGHDIIICIRDGHSARRAICLAIS